MIVEVIGIDDVVSVTPTLDTSAYTSGDRFGSIQTLSNAFRKTYRSVDMATVSGVASTMLPSSKVILQSVTIIDQAKQDQPIDLLFFSSTPTVASADNAAIDISDAEMVAKCIGAINMAEPYIDLAGNSVMTKTGIGLVMRQATGATDQNIYVVPIIRGAGTYAASSVKILYGFLQD